MYENRRTGLLFVLPFLLGVLGFKLFPFVASLALSMTQFDVMSPPEFVGLENYRVLATQDPTFRQSLKVTLLFVVLAVPLRVAFALGIAQVLNFRLRGVSFFRAAFYLPSILGGSIAVAVLWRFIFSQNGLVNIALAKIGVAPVMWLADERYSIWTIVTLFTWQFGFIDGGVSGRAAEHSKVAVRSGRHGRRLQIPAVLAHHRAAADAGDLLQPDHAAGARLPGVQRALHGDRRRGR
jgi:ABC-type sugar transport system permease subunit